MDFTKKYTLKKIKKIKENGALSGCVYKNNYYEYI